MKKSNKLLIGGFLALLLFVTAIHVTLYAKYKAGHYTIFSADDELTQLSMQQFPNILFVSVRDVPSATVKFSDMAQVEKGAGNNVQYNKKGDTLQITSNADGNEPDRPLVFYLPANATLSVFNSSLRFEADKNRSRANPVIYLQTSQAIFSGEQTPLRLGHLKIFASENSQVILGRKMQAAHLDLQLSHSTIEAAEGNFDQLSVATDSLSHISLPAKHLLKATIRTTTQE